MIIKLEDLENLPEQKLILKFNEQMSGIHTDKPVEGTLTVKLTEYGAIVEGQVQTDVVLECDRCLKEFTYHACVDIEEKFVNDSIVYEYPKELELKEESFVEELGDKKEIDITDLVYQSLILGVPVKKLCEENCQGSEDYEIISEEELIDPRLEIFKKLSEE